MSCGDFIELTKAYEKYLLGGKTVNKVNAPRNYIRNLIDHQLEVNEQDAKKNIIDDPFKTPTSKKHKISVVEAFKGETQDSKINSQRKKEDSTICTKQFLKSPQDDDVIQIKISRSTQTDPHKSKKAIKKPLPPVQAESQSEYNRIQVNDYPLHISEKLANS